MQLKKCAFARIFLRVLAPFPIQVRHLIHRPNLRRRVSMAIQTKRHRKRLRLINLLHLVDLPMAFHATEPAINMHRVVEIDVIRHPMNLHPRNRPAAGGALPHQRQPWIILENLVMAVHASPARRHVGIPRLLLRAMAIPAINPQLSSMDGMRKAYWLHRLITDAGILRSQVVPGSGH